MENKISTKEELENEYYTLIVFAVKIISLIGKYTGCQKNIL